MKKLEKDMMFKNAREMCSYLELPFDATHPDRNYKRLECYCNYHRDNKKNIIIDNVFDEPDYSNCEKRNNDYIYNIGEIFNTPSGNIEIIEKIRYTDKNRKAYLCKCSVCKQEYPQVEYNLKKNIGCPICSGRKVIIGINDMWTTAPEIAKFLLNPEDGFKYTKCSKAKVDWKCPICGEIVNRCIANVNKRGFICPHCTKTQSYPNRFMYNLLKYLNISFQNEVVFDWSRFDNTFKRYDFYIPNYGIIEMMGRQHYAYCNFHKLSNKTLQDEIDNDNFKKELAITNNISNYLQINCMISSMEYIKESILNSDFAINFDLSSVDWNYIDEQSQSNVFNYICELWKSGNYDKSEIIDLSGLSKTVVNKDLNKAKNLDLIEYDVKSAKRKGDSKSRYSYYNKYSTPITCKELNLYFGSITLCSKTMRDKYKKGYDIGSIVDIINEDRISRKGLTFQYITKQEFNTYKQKSPESCFGDFFILEEQSA